MFQISCNNKLFKRRASYVTVFFPGCIGSASNGCSIKALTSFPYTKITKKKSRCFWVSSAYRRSMVIALTLETRQRMGWRYAEQQRKRFIENTTNTIGRSLLSTFYNSLRSELIKEEQIYVTFYHCLIDNKKIVNEQEIANRGIPDLLLARDVIIRDTSFLKSLFTIETTKQAR